MEQDECNTELGLGVGFGKELTSRISPDQAPPIKFQFKLFQPLVKEEEKEMTAIKELEDEEMIAVPRKKLRLTEDQSALLENSYVDHTTLTQSRKLELAAELNLQPRQVEVWFQNRRSRTKFKKMKMDNERLKKLCESLADENQRLKVEVLELMMLAKHWQTSREAGEHTIEIEIDKSVTKALT